MPGAEADVPFPATRTLYRHRRYRLVKYHNPSEAGATDDLGSLARQVRRTGLSHVMTSHAETFVVLGNKDPLPDPDLIARYSALGEPIVEDLLLGIRTQREHRIRMEARRLESVQNLRAKSQDDTFKIIPTARKIDRCRGRS